MAVTAFNNNQGTSGAYWPLTRGRLSQWVEPRPCRKRCQPTWSVSPWVLGFPGKQKNIDKYVKTPPTLDCKLLLNQSWRPSGQRWNYTATLSLWLSLTGKWMVIMADIKCLPIRQLPTLKVYTPFSSACVVEFVASEWFVGSDFSTYMTNMSILHTHTVIYLCGKCPVITALSTTEQTLTGF